MKPAELREAILDTAARLADPAAVRPPADDEARLEHRLLTGPDDPDAHAALALHAAERDPALAADCLAHCLADRPALAEALKPGGDLGLVLDRGAATARRYAAARRLGGRLPAGAEWSVWSSLLAETGDREQLARVTETVRQRVAESPARLETLPVPARRGLGRVVADGPLAESMRAAVAALDCQSVVRHELAVRLAVASLDRRAAELVEAGLRRAEQLPHLPADERRRTGRRWLAQTATAAGLMARLGDPSTAIGAVQHCAALLPRVPARHSDCGAPLAAVVVALGRLGLVTEALELIERGAQQRVDQLVALDALAGCWPWWPPVSVATRLDRLRAAADAELADWRDACLAGHLAAAGQVQRALELVAAIGGVWPRAAGYQALGVADDSVRAEVPGEWALSGVGDEAFAAVVAGLDPLEADRVRCRAVLAGGAAALAEAIGEPTLAALAQAAVQARRAGEGDQAAAQRLADLAAELDRRHDLWGRPPEVGLRPLDLWRGLVAGLPAEPLAQVAGELERRRPIDQRARLWLLCDWLERQTESAGGRLARGYLAAVACRLTGAGRAARPRAEQAAAPMDQPAE